ncbi:hypothetical protein bsdcttw_13080 [Anaerocolumna chitinilytica]|uniref:Uncharacterized protein n=1 Tax=Anaerocolumna chitinilytica TaxID=1727145 RepID=A0A7I8DKR1_9FIRM|nr:hypothetical protein bsdcttw_13080 [Anaerocolumna chitinilytica]
MLNGGLNSINKDCTVDAPDAGAKQALIKFYTQKDIFLRLLC